MKIFKIALFIQLIFHATNIFSQDTVVKLNGERILAKVLEIDVDLISYKKLELKNSPIFREFKKDIAYICFANGSKELIQNINGSVSINSGNAQSTNTPAQVSLSSPGTKPLYHLERIGTKYFVNGEKVKRKEAEALMKKSNNPLIPLTLKTAKVMRISQKTVKVASYPAIPLGIYGFIVSLSNTIKASKDGGITFKNYAALGGTFIGTLSFPITNKILKKKTNKLTDKAIDIYNATN